jgi:hypothetical protein
MPKSSTEEDFTVSKGFLSVEIPAGAVVHLDGKTIGNQSLTDFPVWEGGHHLLVTIGPAKWQQNFDERADEHMTYKVETTPGH